MENIKKNIWAKYIGNKNSGGNIIEQILGKYTQTPKLFSIYKSYLSYHIYIAENLGICLNKCSIT